MYNIYLDTETTDTVPGEIAQLSMIIEEVGTNNIMKAANYFFTVNSMSKGAFDVHNLDMDTLFRLSNGQRFKDRSVEIYNILSGNRIVAHNEAFDERFISSELWRCGIQFTPADKLCTMNYFKDIIKIPSPYRRFGPYKNPKLSEVIEFLHINEDKVLEYSERLFNYRENTKFHDSRFDTTAMYVIINVYRERLHNQNTWTKLFTE